MKLYVGVTDFDWFAQLTSEPDLSEVNFWRPSGSKAFRAIPPGGLFLFKLHAPHNMIVGGGIFTHDSILPTSLAWDAFGRGNGATSLDQMRARVLRYRRSRDTRRDFDIGCLILTQPFFFPTNQWIPPPRDWSPNIVQGKTYDTATPLGRALMQATIRAMEIAGAAEQVAAAARARESGYGAPVEIRPRLGQGSFRILVTDAYGRKCAVSGERVLPVLEAAHIRPYADGGGHSLGNGLLLRSDLHTLLDRGYVTVTQEMRFEVSRRIREDFENGRAYYEMHGKSLRVPEDAARRPSAENLSWHNQHTYLG